MDPFTVKREAETEITENCRLRDSYAISRIWVQVMYLRSTTCVEMASNGLVSN
jgi:hypothetical protein